MSGIRMVSFNALQGAFKDARLRRAVEYALDRPAAAAVRGDAPSADPIPPGVPGSGSQIDYPLDRPNLARARALAGRGRHTVTMLVPPGDVDPDGAAIAAIVKRNLARIGISVRLSTVANPFGEVAQGTSRWDLVENGWLADWADPSNFLNGLFDPTQMAYGWTADNGWTAYADQRFIARMRKAYSVGGAARASAYRSLATEMMRVSPPVAVFGRAQAAPQLFSSRIGCQVYRPQDSGWSISRRSAGSKRLAD